ncbi:hypothetical protein [Myceligenerans pegani]|nr:hypothetical protein [Myceligenerans sp. TRM 65318]
MDRFDIEVEGNHNYFVDGVMVHNSPETTTGGKALKFYASVRMDIRRIETLKEGTEPVGNRTRVKVVKNKMAPPFKQAEFDILYGVGISREGGLIDMGVDHGFVRKSGSWFTYEGDQLGQGKENARSFLRDNPDLAAELEKRIKEKLGIGPRVDAPVEGAAGSGDAKDAGGASASGTVAAASSSGRAAATAKTGAKTTAKSASKTATATKATRSRGTKAKETGGDDTAGSAAEAAAAKAPF